MLIVYPTIEKSVAYNTTKNNIIGIAWNIISGTSSLFFVCFNMFL